MEVQTATFKDRTGWEPGPWDGEPDRVEWRSPGGLPCLILRGPQGALCGYVGVPEGHPWHGLDAFDHESRLLDTAEEAAHGGLTFAGPCHEDERLPQEERICHVPQPGESDAVWWLGFDCAHAWDIAPGREANDRRFAAELRAAGNHESADIIERPIRDPDGRTTYKGVAYVTGRVNDLAGAAEAARA